MNNHYSLKLAIVHPKYFPSWWTAVSDPKLLGHEPTNPKSLNVWVTHERCTSARVSRWRHPGTPARSLRAVARGASKRGVSRPGVTRGEGGGGEGGQWVTCPLLHGLSQPSINQRSRSKPIQSVKLSFRKCSCRSQESLCRDIQNDSPALSPRCRLAHHCPQWRVRPRRRVMWKCWKENKATLNCSNVINLCKNKTYNQTMQLKFRENLTIKAQCFSWCFSNSIQTYDKSLVIQPKM